MRLSDIGVILTSIYLIYFFIRNTSISLKFLIIILSLTLIIDIMGSLYNYIFYFSDRTYDFNNAMAIKGFYSNKNITAAAIGLKIPILLILLNYYNTRIIKILIISISSVSFMILYLLSARALFSINRLAKLHPLIGFPVLIYETINVNLGDYCYQFRANKLHIKYIND